MKTTNSPVPVRPSKPNDRSSLFEGLFDKPVSIAFEDTRLSSNGGAVMLAAADRRTGLLDRMLDCLVDRRDPCRVQHSYSALLRHRVHSIALGYFDCFASRATREDPVLQLVCDQRDAALPSQPTLSRFEHAPTAREVMSLGRAFEQHAIDSLAKRHPRAKEITIDLDGTVDPTYGQQAFSEFNRFYGTWCLFPLLGFLRVAGSSEQELFYARLRPGLAKEPRCAVALLERTVHSLRNAFERPRITVRLDAGFSHPRLFDVLDELKVQYVIGYAKNDRLLPNIEDDMLKAKVVSEILETSCAVMGEQQYTAKSWKSARRIVSKAEITLHPGREPRRNPRFVVTNMKCAPMRVWSTYCERGDVENRIKELKCDLPLGQTSCTSYVANQMRVMMCAMAYRLLQELRRHLAGTALANAQVRTLRDRLLKVAVSMKESVRRIILRFPHSFPWKDPWLRLASRLGATPA